MLLPDGVLFLLGPTAPRFLCGRSFRCSGLKALALALPPIAGKLTSVLFGCSDGGCLGKLIRPPFRSEATVLSVLNKICGNSSTVCKSAVRPDATCSTRPKNPSAFASSAPRNLPKNAFCLLQSLHSELRIAASLGPSHNEVVRFECGGL